MRLSTHSQRLERWLGKREVERISDSFKRWYGPPVAIANVPGRVYVRGGGDFVGPILGGYYSHLWDYAQARMKRAWREAQSNSRNRMNSFASHDELISAASTPGRRRDFNFCKGPLTISTTGRAGSLFYAAGSPFPGSLASAAPGGRVCNSGTVGGYPFVDPVSMSQHLINAFVGSNVDGQTEMVYDRLADVAKTMASNATEAVSQTLTRYVNTTPGHVEYAGGNFVFPEVQATLPATAHNQTVWQYTAEDGSTTGQSIPSIAGNANCAAGSIDLPVGYWFMPLAAGDVGLTELTQMQHSASIASGQLAGVVGHPIAVFPSGPAGAMVPFDGINSALNLVPIIDGACLAHLVLPVNATSATTYFGTFSTLAN